MGLLKIFREQIRRRENVNLERNDPTRLKLYEYLSKLGQSVLYCDTDRVIFSQKDNDP